MMPKGWIGKLRTLRADEGWLLLRACSLIPMIALELRLLGFKRAFDRVNRATRKSRKTPETPDHVLQARRLARVIGIASRHGPYPGNCLLRSLALQHLLWRRGIGSTLRIGVRRREHGLAAHAWVELAGVPVNDTLDVGERFTPFQDLLGATRIQIS